MHVMCHGWFPGRDKIISGSSDTTLHALIISYIKIQVALLLEPAEIKVRKPAKIGMVYKNVEPLKESNFEKVIGSPRVGER